MQAQNYYQHQLEFYLKEIKYLKKELVKIAILRLAVFVAGLSLSIFLISGYNSYFSIVALPFIVLFFFLLKKNEQLIYRKKYSVNAYNICKNELNALKGDYSSFDGGDEFRNSDHPYTSDLDIFGENSLFKMLNRTVCQPGKNKLSEILQLKSEKDEIIIRQEIIRELKHDVDFRMDFMAKGMMLKNTREEVSELLNWVEQADYFNNKNWLKKTIYILPTLTLLLMSGSFFVLPVNLFIAAFIFQLMLTALFLRRINFLHSLVSRKFNILNHFSELFEKIEFNNYTSKGLIELKKRYFGGEKSARQQTGKLSSLVRLFDNRLNMLAALLLNGLFLWDLHLSIRLEKWKQQNKSSLKSWIEALAIFDAYNSLANYAYNHSEFNFPEISEEELNYKFDDIFHPLIPPTERIANSFSINGSGSIAIITGSNMAGKSTFLRTLGVNLVLAMTGVPVCAKKMKFWPVQLYSSMRIGDDLANRESTFYAELKRLKQILETTEKQTVFILLDEILKGTNSADKLTGSMALLRQLAKSNSIAVIATHDLALGKLEEEIPEKVKNYNFEVEIRNNEFFFDYKLKNGVCKIMNATELMKKMGVKV